MKQRHTTPATATNLRSAAATARALVLSESSPWFTLAPARCRAAGPMLLRSAAVDMRGTGSGSVLTAQAPSRCAQRKSFRRRSRMWRSKKGLDSDTCSVAASRTNTAITMAETMHILNHTQSTGCTCSTPFDMKMTARPPAATLMMGTSIPRVTTMALDRLSLTAGDTG